jgi:8-oxo-dGTP pyrophosphatase MutT (NUDIX family)
VLNQTGSHVLLGLHRKVGRWLQFGGHIEPNDPSVAAAALREAQEESGIFDLQLSDPEPVQLDVHPAPCAHDARFHLDVEFLAIAKNGSLPQASAESLAVQWFDADDLPSDTDDAVRRLVTASVRRLDMHAR